MMHFSWLLMALLLALVYETSLQSTIRMRWLAALIPWALYPFALHRQLLLLTLALPDSSWDTRALGAIRATLLGAIAYLVAAGFVYLLAAAPHAGAWSARYWRSAYRVAFAASACLLVWGAFRSLMHPGPSTFRNVPPPLGWMVSALVGFGAAVAVLRVARRAQALHKKLLSGIDAVYEGAGMFALADSRRIRAAAPSDISVGTPCTVCDLAQGAFADSYRNASAPIVGVTCIEGRRSDLLAVAAKQAHAAFVFSMATVLIMTAPLAAWWSIVL